MVSSREAQLQALMLRPSYAYYCVLVQEHTKSSAGVQHFVNSYVTPGKVFTPKGERFLRTVTSVNATYADLVRRHPVFVLNTNDFKKPEPPFPGDKTIRRGDLRGTGPVVLWKVLHSAEINFLYTLAKYVLMKRGTLSEPEAAMTTYLSSRLEHVGLKNVIRHSMHEYRTRWGTDGTFLTYSLCMNLPGLKGVALGSDDEADPM